MKKIAALVTTLILGASSVALAAPGWGQSPSYGAANDRAPYAARFRPTFRPTFQTWTTLEANGSLARGRDFIDVSSNARFSKLKLEATGRGSVHIEKLVIVFGNGQRQVVNVDKRLNGRSGATLIDVEGRSRNIDKILVMGRGGFRASYSLSAR